jgi:REP element-mobilizing transposase RayT
MTLFHDRYRIPSARLHGWDYAAAGCYFVTICTQNRACILGTVGEGGVILSAAGWVVDRCWREIPLHHDGVFLDEFVVMPNHLHGIVGINDTHRDRPSRRDVACNVSTNHPNGDPPPRRDVACNVSTKPSSTMSSIAPPAGSLGTIIRSFKSAVTKHCRAAGLDFAWQSRYHDRIIRDVRALAEVREYLRNNPAQWHLDWENPELANNLTTTNP